MGEIILKTNNLTVDFKIKKNYNIYQYIPNFNSNIPKYVCNYDYEYYINERN